MPISGATSSTWSSPRASPRRSYASAIGRGPRVGLQGLSDAEWIALVGRFEPLPGSFTAPLALRCHGHQFRSYNPDLGDGRDFLHAQLHDLRDGRLLDLGTKDSGTTPYSRAGDGRLTLKGGVREVLATALLKAQGGLHLEELSPIEAGEKLERAMGPPPPARRCWSA